jgi:hypothetical protein
MVFVFYNKALLRVLTAIVGLLSGVCAWHYISLSGQKLGQAGVSDALAIVSFLLAGWLVMLIAEVVDNHYVRVFGALGYLLGAAISFKWIFRIDGPKLAELTGGGSRLQMAALAFWLGAGLTSLLLLILVSRLIIDKLNFGRLPSGQADEAHNQPAPEPPLATGDAEPELPPLAAPLTALRRPAAVTSLSGVAGPYTGTVFALHAGTQSIGRQGTDILLELDSQVSRNHASIEIGADGLAKLQDSGSTNGTWVNGQRVQQITLAPGDKVQIGLSEFRAEA